jgi:uncharacterized protein (TIGR02217 family)
VSNLVYPTLPGLTWSVTKSPMWKTRVQTSVRGRELRIRDQIYPRWKFQQVYSFLNGSVRCTPGVTDIQVMMNFFQTVQGSWDNWLFNDPTDNFVANQLIGIGAGAPAAFQLARTFYDGGFAEPIIAPISWVIRFDGVVQSSGVYSVNTGNGIVTFGSSVGSGVQVTADIHYYFRCRFTTDTLDFEEFAKDWWELKKIEFESVLL